MRPFLRLGSRRFRQTPIQHLLNFPLIFLTFIHPPCASIITLIILWDFMQKIKRSFKELVQSKIGDPARRPSNLKGWEGAWGRGGTGDPGVPSREPLALPGLSFRSPLKPPQAQAIGDHGHRAHGHCGGGQGRIEGPAPEGIKGPGGHGDGHGVVAEGPEEVLADDSHHLAGESDGLGDEGQVVPD